MHYTLSALPRRARFLFWIVVAAASGLAGLIAVRSLADGVLWRALAAVAPTALGAAALVFLGRLFPVALTEKNPVKVTFRLDGVVLFAAILLWPESQAVMITGLGVGLHQLYVYFRKHERWYLCLFNTSQKMVAMGLTAAVYRLTPGDATLPLSSVHNPLPLAAATGVYFLVNTGLISMMLAFMGSRHPWEVWVKTHRWTWHLYLSHLILGIIVADLYLTAPLTLPLMAIVGAGLRHAYVTAAMIRRRTQETIELLADAVDGRTPYTERHSQKVADYCRLIGQRLALPVKEVEAIVEAARVHDVGKAAVPDALLAKPGMLSRAERDEVRRHVMLGAQILGRLPQYARGKDYILYHHEWYDGSGTVGLHGEEIPLGARILAVADAFHAMTSERPYRRAMGFVEAITEMKRREGTQLDPVVVEALLAALGEPPPSPPAPEIRRRDILIPCVSPEVTAGSPMVRH